MQFVLAVLVFTSFVLTSAADVSVDVLLEEPSARLIKDHDPIAEATYHESDPVVAASISSDNLPRLVKNRGPLTKKIVASGSTHPGLDLSLIAWKFADGSFAGSIEEKLDNGETLVKVDVDCIDVQDGRAIVSGTIGKTNRKGVDSFLYKRAHAVVVDEGITEKLSGLIVGLPDDVTCQNLAQNVDAVPMYAGVATVCNRRDGEDAWLDCVDSIKATK